MYTFIELYIYIYIYQHNLLGFVDQCVIHMFMIFSFKNSMLVYSFESLSLKPVQGNGVVYLTILAPLVVKCASWNAATISCRVVLNVHKWTLLEEEARGGYQHVGC